MNYSGYELYNRKKFYYGKTYLLADENIPEEFTVESCSNDDLLGQKWVNQINLRLSRAPVHAKHLIAAFCPTLHEGNNFVELLSNPPFINYEKLHIFLIKNKFEHHAKLEIKNIVTAGQNIPNINFITINANDNISDDSERLYAKLMQIRTEMSNILC